jgi:ribosomal protein S18 acetylase RimI-like enzyme
MSGIDHSEHLRGRRQAKVSTNNFERMIRLAEEFFDAKNDPDQLAVDEAVIGRLRALDPASLAEEDDGFGPVAWVLMIPTTEESMQRFIAGSIGERALLEETLPGAEYEAIYLCSALVLPEYRDKGVARRLTLRGVEEIRSRHPIKVLYYWPFSEEGRKLASSVAAGARLPLLERPAQ